MVDPTSIPGGLQPTPNTGIGDKSRAQGAEEQQGDIAFRALLEKLEEKAHALQETTESIDKPEELAGAVEIARRSLGDALSLGEDLLEAYRAVQYQQEDEE